MFQLSIQTHMLKSESQSNGARRQTFGMDGVIR